MTKPTKERVQEELQKLVGLELVLARRAADLRNLGFGEYRVEADRSWGDFALHIQCAWRIDGPEGVLTGDGDLHRPADGFDSVDYESWDYEQSENLQDRRIAEWLGPQVGRLGSCPPPGKRPVVLAVRALPFGCAEIDLSGGYRLTLFSDGSVGEDWRLFQPGVEDGPHFVVAGGQIEEPD